LRRVFPDLHPLPPRPPSLFSLNMDAIAVEHTLQEYVKGLRAQDQLFTQQEFDALDNTKYIHAHKCIGHMVVEKWLGHHFFVEDNTIKIPKHIAVINTPAETLRLQVGPWKSLNLLSSDIDIYIEKITPLDRKATREEMTNLLWSFCFYGIRLLHEEHVMMGKNEKGEEGIFLVDIDQMQLGDPPAVPSLNCLTQLISPDDHQWLHDQIQRIEEFYAPVQNDLGEMTDRYHRLMRPLAVMHGFGLMRTFTLPIENIFKG
jgi:hypothetical protein